MNETPTEHHTLRVAGWDLFAATEARIVDLTNYLTEVRALAAARKEANDALVTEIFRGVRMTQDEDRRMTVAVCASMVNVENARRRLETSTENLFQAEQRWLLAVAGLGVK